MVSFYNRMTFRKNFVIIENNLLATKLYIILAGSCALKVKYTIRIHADDIEIREKTFATYVSGQHFGESALHSNEKRTGTVVALTKCDIVVLTKAVYQVFMEDLKIGRVTLDLKGLSILVTTRMYLFLLVN